MTREQWLQSAIDALRPAFDGVGKPLPPTVHVSIGFPSTNATSRRKTRVGECWYGKASQDGHCHIFISPVHQTPLDALDTLTHELVHVVTPGARHRGQFITVCKAIGLTQGKPTSAHAGPELRSDLERIVAQLGPVPYAMLNALAADKPKTQSTRLLKLACVCGYTVRTTQKWVDVGLPLCPCGQELSPV